MKFGGRGIGKDLEGVGGEEKHDQNIMHGKSLNNF